jgi:hypothetical protein
VFGANDHGNLGSSRITAQIGLGVVGVYKRLLVSSFEALVRVAILVVDDNKKTSRETFVEL